VNERPKKSSSSFSLCFVFALSFWEIFIGRYTSQDILLSAEKPIARARTHFTNLHHLHHRPRKMSSAIASTTTSASFFATTTRKVHRSTTSKRGSSSCVVSSSSEEFSPIGEKDDDDDVNNKNNNNNVSSSRRAAIVSGFSAVLAVSASTSPAAFAADKDEEKKKKVVAVPYTPYVPQSESSEEMLEVAKQLKDAGARLYGAFWCENCNKQKETLGKEAMEMIEYVECFPDGVYQNAPDGRADVTKPAEFCGPYSESWPMWVLPSPSTPETPEIGVQGKVLKAKELKKLVKEAGGEKVDLVKYFTTLEVK
jgi:hypothetical protein